MANSPWIQSCSRKRVYGGKGPGNGLVFRYVPGRAGERGKRPAFGCERGEDNQDNCPVCRGLEGTEADTDRQKPDVAIGLIMR